MNEEKIFTRCDLCHKRNVEVNPTVIAGETYNLCNSCYEGEAQRGFI